MHDEVTESVSPPFAPTSFRQERTASTSAASPTEQPSSALNLDQTGRPSTTSGVAGWWQGDHAVYQTIKRGIDIAGAVAGLVTTSPILLAAAVAIRWESPGPVIFRQTRIGRYEQPFTLYKFRGMYVDARERFPEMYAYRYESESVSELVFHPKEDPRVTRVGRFLRRTSIDELPNLWNVLKGDMSLIGPRPEIPEMLPYYGDAKDTVLSVKPGVTSPAKANGRDELTFGETLALDLEYVRSRSLWLDLKILGQTVVAVLRQDGMS